MCVSPLGLPVGVDEDTDGFGVAGPRRPGEVGRGLANPAGTGQGPGDGTVDGVPACGAETLVDRLLDQGVGDLVGHLPAAVILGDQAGSYEPVKHRSHDVERLTGQVDDPAQLDAPTEDGQYFQARPGSFVEVGQPRRHPVGQCLGKALETWGAEIGVFLEQSVQQAHREQGVPAGAIVEPGDQGGGGGVPEDGLRQPGDCFGLEWTELDAPQQIVLLEVVQDLGGPRLAGQLHWTSRRHDQDRERGQGPRQVMEGIPGRAVGHVDVVEEHDHRTGAGEVGDEHGQPLEEPGAGRFSRGCSAPHGRSAVEEAAQIVDESAAQLGNLVPFKVPEVAFQRFGPQAERRGVPEGMGPSGEPEHLAVVAGQQLPHQAGLPDTGICEQQHDAELARPGPDQFGLQERQLVPAPDQCRALRNGNRGRRWRSCVRRRHVSGVPVDRNRAHGL